MTNASAPKSPRRPQTKGLTCQISDIHCKGFISWDSISDFTFLSITTCLQGSLTT